MKRLVLLGGGHAHVEVLRAFAEAPPPEGWEITLVSPHARQIYSGMVPGHIAGHYALDECAIDLEALAKRARARFHRTAATLVRPADNEVLMVDTSEIAYDLLSVDVGSQPAIGAARGVKRHAVVLRPLETGLERWNAALGRIAAGGITSVTIVGGGAAGVEVALAMARRFRRDFGEGAPHLRVITDAVDVASEFAPGARKRLRRLLAARGIGVHTGIPVTEVGPDFVRLETGIEFASGLTFWSAGAQAPDWIRDSAFATDKRGYLLTNDCLQSVIYRNVFAAGDCATQEAHPRPKAGVFAVRAAPVLAANLRQAMTGAPLRRSVTPATYLALVSAGDPYAVGVWNGFSWEGPWVWRWKDRIDRGYVGRYAASF